MLASARSSPSEVYFVNTGGPDAYGPWQSKPVADLVAKIINMQDEGNDAVVEALDLNPYASQLIAGLRPFHITITKNGNTILEKNIELCWPPESESCKLREEESVVEYFVWAKTQTEAYRIMASLSSSAPLYRPVFDVDDELSLSSDTDDE